MRPYQLAAGPGGRPCLTHDQTTAGPRWVAAVVGAGGSARGGPAAAKTARERALPRGWSLLVTDSELVIRHDRACFLVDGSEGGHLINLELRYRLEPKWTARQLADAKA